MSNTNFDNNLIDSILTVNASENVTKTAQQDLDLPEGKSIADLLNDEKNIKKDSENNEENEKLTT